MSSYKITVKQCDRCGTSEEFRSIGQEYDWAHISAKQINGPNQICSADATRDLCPSCAASLWRWWEAKQ